MSDWQEVTGEQGRTIRWREVAKDETEAQKTVYVGTVVEGVYEARRDNIGENASSIYQIRTKEHGVLNVWTTTVLKDKMDAIAVGSEIRIEKTGEQKPKSGGKAYYTFKVFHRPAPMTEVKPATEELPPM